MTKLCECGCGNLAPIAKQTDSRTGYKKGETKKFIHGHYNRNLKDLTGKKFGKLTIVSRNASKGKYENWLCLCECGNKKTISGYDLCKGRVKTCGCHLIEIKSRTNCQNGHEYTKENTFKRSNGTRGCRKCGRMRTRKWTKNNKEHIKKYEKNYRSGKGYFVLRKRLLNKSREYNLQQLNLFNNQLKELLKNGR